MKEMMVYLKTTETCNLNCMHCFTNGRNGPKIFWNPITVVDWLHRLNKELPNIPHMHLEFHGGEPFLAPIDSLYFVYDNCQGLWRSQSWGLTSNLTFKMTDEHIRFIKGPLQGRVGTSWDPDIRFENEKQSALWESNVRRLIDEGIEIKLNVSVTKSTIELDPITLIGWVRDLGIKDLAFERLTVDGSAKKNPEIFPTNEDQDRWFVLMHEQTIEHNARDWVVNELLESVYDKFDHNLCNSGTFCRDCEQKLFTLNADGSIAGCPNSAPESFFGNIRDDIPDLLNNKTRLKTIACETARDPRCYQCEVFSYCNSDCRQLPWDEDICGAPKTLMKKLAGIE